MSAHQFQNTPEARILPVGEIRADAQNLFTQFAIADCIVETEARILLRVKAVEHPSRQEDLDKIAMLGSVPAKRNFPGIAHRCVLKGPVDLGLAESGLVAIGTAA